MTIVTTAKHHESFMNLTSLELFDSPSTQFLYSAKRLVSSFSFNNLGSRCRQLSTDTKFGVVTTIIALALIQLRLAHSIVKLLATFAAGIVVAKVVIYTPDSYNVVLSRKTKEYWLDFAYANIGNGSGIVGKVGSIAMLGLLGTGTFGLGLAGCLGLYQGAVSVYMENRAGQESRKTSIQELTSHYPHV